MKIDDHQPPATADDDPETARIDKQRRNSTLAIVLFGLLYIALCVESVLTHGNPPIYSPPCPPPMVGAWPVCHDPQQGTATK
ncbi:MAG TPA: hypothetical protein VKY85_16395 [Candidatus Angelobacter sp.]|nr:hypothetical protein [Candidatus Angelobacter sp.]